MKSASFIVCCTALLITTINPAKRPKQSTSKEEHAQAKNSYQPNPIVLAGVGEIMNGALSIAQDPHNRPNIGHSVASMVHGIATIIIEKLAHKKLTINDQNALQECCNEVCSHVSEEIVEVITSLIRERDL